MNKRYDFDTMEVGDTLTYAKYPFNYDAGKAYVSQAAYSYGSRHNMKFSCRTKGDLVQIKRIK